MELRAASIPEMLHHRPIDPAPRYRLAGHHPTGALANPSRYDPTGRPWEYGDGGYCHRWLGPADPGLTEAQIRDDFFALCRARADYHARMAARWSSAARFPWLPADPDPPGPPLIYDPPGDSY